jgi:pyrroloquinoline-quinone synthase
MFPCSLEVEMLQLIDALIEKHHLLKHPFYRAWTEGTLSRETLGHYAQQYYCHVQAFPRHLARLSQRCEGQLRELVLDNLREELDPAAPHPKLWRDFADALGVSQVEAEPLPGVAQLVSLFDELVEGPLEGAVAAFYAYEAQVPEIAVQKREGLQRFYGLTDPAAVAYFAVHEEADMRHRAAWAGWLQEHGQTDEAAESAERALKALWGALDAIYPHACAA